MRFVLLSILAPCLLANAMPSVGFRDFVLGQSLEDARKVVIASGSYGPKRLVCSEDDEPPRALVQSATERQAGIVLCRVFNEIGGTLVAADLDLGDGAAVSNEFKFVHNKLFFIFLAADIQHEMPIASALEARFGKPSKEATDTASNGFGALVSKRIKEWSIGAKSVRMTAPDLTVRRLTVTYIDQPLEAVARAALLGSSTITM